MEKNGKLTPEEMGIEAYRAWREALAIIDPPTVAPEWVALSQNTRNAWMLASNKIDQYGRRGRLEGRNWRDIGEWFYGFLAEAGAFPLPAGESATPYASLTSDEQFLMQVAVRHLIDVVQQDDGEDTDDSLRELMERVPSLVERFITMTLPVH